MRQFNASWQFSWVLSVLAVLSGCGGDEGAQTSSAPWGDDITVIGTDGTETNHPIASDATCISSASGDCVSVEERCGPGVPADVVVDSEGNLIDIVCYPTSGTLTPEQIESQQGDVVQNQNGAVVVLDNAPGDVALEGDLAVDANNVVVYGSGPDVSVMSGDLTLDGNNAIVRGIRVIGSLTVLKNDSAFLYCVIEGDVVIVGNNTRISGCDIFGSVRVEGTNTELLGNRIQGNVEVIGDSTICTDNIAFEDANADLAVQSTEVGAALACP